MVKKSPNPKANATVRHDDREQYAAFKKAAREVGANRSDKQFKETLRSLAKQRPSNDKAK